ncbi:MAG: hypothetical protein AB7F20_05095 [Geoalkalibacter sp.]|jgi:hypothetical protein
MVDRRKKLQREITFTLAAEMQTILTSEIPYASDVEKWAFTAPP